MASSSEIINSMLSGVGNGVDWDQWFNSLSDPTQQNILGTMGTLGQGQAPAANGSSASATTGGNPGTQTSGNSLGGTLGTQSYSDQIHTAMAQLAQDMGAYFNNQNAAPAAQATTPVGPLYNYNGQQPAAPAAPQTPTGPSAQQMASEAALANFQQGGVNGLGAQYFGYSPVSGSQSAINALTPPPQLGAPVQANGNNYYPNPNGNGYMMMFPVDTNRTQGGENSNGPNGMGGGPGGGGFGANSGGSSGGYGDGSGGSDGGDQ